MPSTNNLFLDLYRKIVKPIKPFHRFVHAIANQFVLPALERRKKFLTVKEDPFWFRYELLTGRHEAETVSVVKGLVKPGMIVLDIGAHAGYYSVVFARLMQGDGRILAFEPHPETVEILKQNISRFGIVQSIPFAVSDHEGSAELFDYLMMSASGSLHYDESIAAVQRSQVSEYDLAPRLEEHYDERKFSIRTIKLDDFLPSIGVSSIDFIKMDIEGAELTALRGMRNLIGSSPSLKMIMEFNPQALKTFIAEPQAAVAEVLSYGFTQAFALMPDGSAKNLLIGDTLNSLTRSLMERMAVVNILFSRE